jgi:hypothetical protein
VSAGVLHKFDKGAAGRFGMNEGHQVPTGARAGFLVDEVEPLGIQILEGRAQVGDPISDVVNAGPPAGEEPGDGAGVGSRLDEFYGSDKGYVHVVFGKFLDAGTSGPGDGFEGCYGLSDGRDCDADVVEWEFVHESVQ